MKSVLKVISIRTIKDVNNIRNVISNNEGIVACEVNKEKQEVSVVYDEFFIKEENIIDCIENTGYTVI